MRVAPINLFSGKAVKKNSPVQKNNFVSSSIKSNIDFQKVPLSTLRAFSNIAFKGSEPVLHDELVRYIAASKSPLLDVGDNYNYNTFFHDNDSYIVQKLQDENPQPEVAEIAMSMKNVYGRTPLFGYGAEGLKAIAKVLGPQKAPEVIEKGLFVQDIDGRTPLFNYDSYALKQLAQILGPEKAPEVIEKGMFVR